MATKHDHLLPKPLKGATDTDIDPAIDALLDLLAEWSVLRESYGKAKLELSDP